MRQKLLLFGKTPLSMQRISIITSLVLSVVTVGNFFLKTFTIIDDFSFQNSAIRGKEYSYSYFVSDNHWDNDNVHYEEEDRENEYDRETA
ncbi:MAG: hypothetical protein E3K36_14890 [Candidatus Brocadia sp.]|nr:hypothetical protein [Candidatus Brocadia sp.]